MLVNQKHGTHLDAAEGERGVRQRRRQVLDPRRKRQRSAACSPATCSQQPIWLRLRGSVSLCLFPGRLTMTYLLLKSYSNAAISRHIANRIAHISHRYAPKRLKGGRDPGRARESEAECLASRLGRAREAPLCRREAAARARAPTVMGAPRPFISE